MIEILIELVLILYILGSLGYDGHVEVAQRLKVAMIRKLVDSVGRIAYQHVENIQVGKGN